MPVESHNAFAVGASVPVNRVLDGAIIIGLPVVPGVVRRVVLHIETLHQGALPDFRLQLFVVVVGLPRQDRLSVVV